MKFFLLTILLFFAALNADHLKQLIHYWDSEQFALLEKVKEKESIAIELGATSAVNTLWFAANFYHVVAAESDPALHALLQTNLKDVENVSICPLPIAAISQGSKALTFKQFLFDYVYRINHLKEHKIAFIRCDMGGAEENILEDILHFAYYNKAKVQIAFHLDCWTSHRLADFRYLFNFFKTNIPISELLRNPTASILFEPLEDAGLMVKKNMPVFIIGYNQVTYIKNMVNQLEKYTSDITVIDNKSFFQPLRDYYEKEFKYTLLRQNANYGCWVWNRPEIQKLAGDLFILTDPDLRFNPKLPDDFIEQLLAVSNYFEANRVGFALLIDADDIRTDVFLYGKSIKQWERRFWRERLIYPPDPALELYDADIDTTFCLINKRHREGRIRVAGDFTCVHIPWHKGFEKDLSEGEFTSYQKGNNSTNFWGSNSR
jgi:hypothetical protein